MQQGEGQIVNELGQVRACGCGGVNITVGPVTLHVAADNVDALFGLACAAKHLASNPGRKASKSGDHEPHIKRRPRSRAPSLH